MVYSHSATLSWSILSTWGQFLANYTEDISYTNCRMRKCVAWRVTQLFLHKLHEYFHVGSLHKIPVPGIWLSLWPWLRLNIWLLHQLLNWSSMTAMILELTPLVIPDCIVWAEYLIHENTELLSASQMETSSHVPDWDVEINCSNKKNVSK